MAILSKLAGSEFASQGYEGEAAFKAYQGLREKLDEIFVRAEKYPDPKTNGAMLLPKVVIELRADGDTEYRVIQEVIQVITDSVNPGLSKDVITGQDDVYASNTKPPTEMKPFVHFNYTTRTPGDEG